MNEGDPTNRDRVFLISADGQHRIDSTVQEIVGMFEFVRELKRLAALRGLSDGQMDDYLMADDESKS